MNRVFHPFLILLLLLLLSAHSPVMIPFHHHLKVGRRIEDSCCYYHD